MNSERGSRLARLRDQLLAPGASQPAGSGQEVVTFTQKQLEVLEKWDSGQLLAERNKSIADLGHGRLQTASGDFLDIGGSTGGGSRRIIDGWKPPDWSDFLEDAQ